LQKQRKFKGLQGERGFFDKHFMQVTVLLFGYMREIVGKSQLTLQNIPNTSQLKLQLKRLYPALQDTEFLIAVDREVITGDIPLQDNYTIALLPPYAGG
jgi:molybdopterin synthase sulfur carrier subunit